MGLALELPVPDNRNICLTNKIFTYLLAGNAIIFSETEMQKDFCKAYKVGQLFNNKDVDSLLAIIKNYKDSKELTSQRKYNYQLAGTKFNWDYESQKLLNYLSNG